MSKTALEFKDAEGDDPTAIVTKALEGLQAKIDDRFSALEKKQANDNGLGDRLDKIEAKLNRPGLTRAMSEAESRVALETKAFADYLRNPNSLSLETKTLRVSNDPQGGIFAPVDFTTEFVRDLVLYSPIRSVASVKQTSYGSVSLLKRTAITNAKWKGELDTSEESEPVFGGLEIPVREMNTYVDISNQLLQDSAVDVSAEVRLALAEDFGNKEGLAFVSGTGPLQPRGLLTAASIPYWLMGAADTFTFGELIQVMQAMPAFYRNRGTWLMNGKTAGALRMLNSGLAQPYWQPSLQEGQPSTLLGRPVVEVPDFPDIAAGTSPIMFGDFQTGYRIIDRLDMTTLVNPYALMTQGATRIHATRRVGADVIQPKAMARFQMAPAS